MSFEPAEQQPAENIARGTLFALLALPAGIIVWVVLWNLGFIASIVGFAVAYAAMFLYKVGSGGVLSRTGALRVALVTIGTLLIAFFAGVVSDVLGVWTAETGDGALPSLVSPEFWDAFQSIIGIDGVVASYLPDFGLALLFGALGCFGLLRRAFRSTRNAQAAPPAFRSTYSPPGTSLPAQSAAPDWATDDATIVAPQHPPLAPPAPPVAHAAPAPGEAAAPADPVTPRAPGASGASVKNPGRFEEFRDPNYRG